MFSPSRIVEEKKDVMSEERPQGAVGSDEFHVFPETRRRVETNQGRYTATKGKNPEIFLIKEDRD